MNGRRVASPLMIVVGAFRGSSCAWAPTYVSHRSVPIDKVLTSTGSPRVKGANYDYSKKRRFIWSR